MPTPVLSSNAPSAGFISWPTFSIQYMGTGYSVSGGSTDKRFVWWRYSGGSPILEADDEIPQDLTVDDLVLFGNRNGIAVNIQTAGLIDGDLMVDGSIFANALASNFLETRHLNTDVAWVGSMSADNITSGNLVSSMALVGDLSVGTNIDINPTDGIVIRTPLGDTKLPADGAQPQFTGQATFNALTVNGNMLVSGETNTIGGGSSLELSEGVTAPKTAPVMSAVYPNIPFGDQVLTHRGGPAWFADEFVYYVGGGAFPDHSALAYTISEVNGVNEFEDFSVSVSGTTDPGGGAWNRTEVTEVRDVTISGSSMYVLCKTSENIPNQGTKKRWYIYKGVWSTIQSKWNYNTRWMYEPNSTLGGYSGYEGAIGYDTANSRVLVAQCDTSGVVKVTAYTTAGVYVSVSTPLDVTSITASSHLYGVGIEAADFGSNHLWFATSNFLYVHNTSTMALNGSYWGPLASNCRGVAWDPDDGHFRSINRVGATDVISKYTTNMDHEFGAAHTWRKADATGPDYALYETPTGGSAGSTTVYNARRAHIQISSGTIPNNPSDSNSPDAVSFYISDATPPSGTYWDRTNLHRIATPAVGETSVLLSSVSMTGANPPATTTFPDSSSPARIFSGAQNGSSEPWIEINADGSWRMGRMSGDANGRITAEGVVPGYDGDENWKWVGRPPGVVPIGTIIMWAGNSSTIPWGWLECDGASYSASTYPDLYAVLGTTTLPDLNDRVPIGEGTKTIRSSSSTSYSRTVPVPQHAHGHTFSIVNDGDHNHTLHRGGAAGNGSYIMRSTGLNISNAGPIDPSGSHSHTLNGSISNSGTAGATMDVTPKYYTVFFLIRATYQEGPSLG